jgi:hypothetical protein
MAAVAAVALAAAAGCSKPETSGSDTPPPPADSAPALFLGDAFTATQRATRAVVDAGTIWLLDDDGDFVFGTDPAANWDKDSGLALVWKQVPGAARYHVLARNVVTSPTTWTEIAAAIEAPDPRSYPIVVAKGLKPWAFGLGTGGNPWSFGNAIELVVSADDAAGANIASGITAPLATSDEFPGVLTSVAIDPALPEPFAPHVERGVTFTKTFLLGLSEPMLTDVPPGLEVQHEDGAPEPNVRIRRVVASAWSADGQLPSGAPPSAAPYAIVQLELSVKGACTEVRVARSAGDLILVVRDATLFQVDPAAGVLLVDGATGAFVDAATGVSAVDGTLGRIALGTPLAADVPAGALACAISGGPSPLPSLVAESGARITVTDATPFFVGETVVVYEPSARLLDVRTVAGVDSVDRVLALSAPLSAGHGPASVVVALNGLGGEVALRSSADLALARDAVGGTDTELFVADPQQVMIGDRVLVDADGDLRTVRAKRPLPDQVQATVKQVRLAPAPGALPSIVVDLPAGMILVHGEAKVLGLGDAFAVGGTRDTTAKEITPLDPHADQFTADGLLY